MNEEKISIIVPVYNVEAYLERCVESILKQTYTNLEILLVNDGSTDKSGELCDKLALRDHRIRVIHKENGGLSDARNRGIDEASSNLIGFIDSDDYIDEDMYETLYRQMVASKADLSMCGHYDVYHQIPEKQVAEIKTWELMPEEAIKMVMEAKILSVTAVNKLYKKALFEQLRFRIGKIAEDAFIMVDLIHQCSKIVATNEKKYYYVHRENSITTQKFSLKFLNVIEAYEQNAKIISENYPDLYDVAIMRLNWAYFYVLDRLLVDNDFKDKVLEDRLISYLKKNKKSILMDSRFTRARKMSFLALCLSRKLYLKILLAQTKR
ncbi:glycosyltransferase family 2 protein [uncultured Streptococcus sp.]|uniref:glycosyltransferase family 2 protein n=1 Tax=uncultured Streptococcus sp. TaxID=83427 RepID=UPI0028D27716|nr:glycosyltransferase family 2 protein [uncultured Streptococcus sp.]